MKKISFVIVLLFAGLVWSCGDADTKEKREDPFNVETAKKEKTPEAEASSTVVSEEPEPEAEPEVVIPIPPEQIEKAKEIIASVSEADLAAIDGKKKYKTLCSACHGTDGKMGVSGAKDLTKISSTLEENVAQIYHGKGLMIPFKDVFTEAEIVAVAKYVRNEIMK